MQMHTVLLCLGRYWILYADLHTGVLPLLLLSAAALSAFGAASLTGFPWSAGLLVFILFDFARFVKCFFRGSPKRGDFFRNSQNRNDAALYFALQSGGQRPRVLI